MATVLRPDNTNNGQMGRKLAALEQLIETISDASVIQMKIAGADSVGISAGSLIPFTNITFKTPDMVVNDTNTTITLPKKGVYRVELILQGGTGPTIVFPLVNGVQDQRMTFAYNNGAASTFVRAAKDGATLSLQATTDMTLNFTGSVDLASLLVEYVGDLQLV